MEAVKSAVLQVCLVLIASGAVLLLAPSGEFGRPLRFLCSAVVLCVLLSALSADYSSLTDELELYDAELPTTLSEAADYGYTAAAEATMRELILRTLDKISIEPEEIQIKADKTADGGIYFTDVTVLLDSGDAARTDEVYHLLAEEIGKDVAVKAQEE